MRAFIYAAGRGLRLGPEHGSKAKILLSMGGRTLLEWHVRRLRAVQVERVDVVVGYQADVVGGEMQRLEAAYGIPVRPILNVDYTEGSVLSLAVSLPEIETARDPVLIMDGDVLYGGDMLPRLIHSPHRSALLIDRSYSTADDDPVLVPVRGGRPIDFKKQWKGECDLIGESIGFFKVDTADIPAMAAATRRRATGASRRESYDEVLRDLVIEGRFDYEDVTGMHWTEVDFPGDIEYAVRKVLPWMDGSQPP